MSLGDWIIIGILVLGFIITWIACSKPLEGEPGSLVINPYDYEKDNLKTENYTLRRKLYDLERELQYRKYDGWDLQALRKILERPVEVSVDVNINND